MKRVERSEWKLNEDQLKAILESERTNAIGATTSSDLSEQRVRAFDYYMGDMDDTLPADDGTSAAVSTDVQDVVEGALPIILDVFTNGEHVVEFKPTGPNDVAAAQQETDVINHVFYQENDGFLVLYTAIKDALLQKNGFVKWWMENELDRSRAVYEGVPQDAYALLTQNDDFTIIRQKQYIKPDPLTGQPATFYDCVVEKSKTRKVLKVAAVPPEEVLVTKTARRLPQANYLAHVSTKPQADLLEMFKDTPGAADIIKQAPGGLQTADNFEATERSTVQDGEDQLLTSDDVNRDLRLIETVEHYIRLALEKDGVVRRYRITTVGSKYSVVDVEEVSEWQMATGTGIIMSHRLFGRALADLVTDVQEIKTSLLRAILNNAYFANNQRIEISETHAGENTIDDLLNNRIGGVVRTKMPGGLNPLPAQPIGNWAQNVVEYMDSVKENRTGISRYNQGLDADSLNHTATGITRIMDAAEMRIKLMTRIFAETLIVDMFRGIHGMLQENSEEARDIELRGQWVTVDPAEWSRRRHMTVTLPLGGLGRQQMLMFFSNVLSVQKEIIQDQGGPNGPLCSYENVYNTLDQMTKLGGLKSTDPYFMHPGPPNPAGNPPKPDPRMVEAQAKAQSTQAQTQAQMQLDAAQAQHETQMEQLKLASQRQRELDEFQHKAALDKVKFAHDAAMEQLKADAKIKLEAFMGAQKMQLEREKMENDAELNRQQATLDRQQGVDNV